MRFIAAALMGADERRLYMLRRMSAMFSFGMPLRAPVSTPRDSPSGLNPLSPPPPPAPPAAAPPPPVELKLPALFSESVESLRSGDGRCATFRARRWMFAGHLTLASARALRSDRMMSSIRPANMDAAGADAECRRLRAAPAAAAASLPPGSSELAPMEAPAASWCPTSPATTPRGGVPAPAPVWCASGSGGAPPCAASTARTVAGSGRDARRW
mmetsp:Transcript_27959/g.96629  ORF Transcript_27959/g.96629 Transcript_27959/m.96629 type:complete len:214 (+) Transcript_27959:545-1186(+)